MISPTRGKTPVGYLTHYQFSCLSILSVTYSVLIRFAPGLLSTSFPTFFASMPRCLKKFRNPSAAIVRSDMISASFFYTLHTCQLITLRCYFFTLNKISFDVRCGRKVFATNPIFIDFKKIDAQFKSNF